MRPKTIWVDADACPKAIKEILYRSANRNDIDLVLIANQALKVPSSKRIRTIRVEAGFDMADKWIGQRVKDNDLVITADIPLAAEVIDKGAQALNPRGYLYTRDNIRQSLSMRDFMDTLRSSGIDTCTPQILPDSRFALIFI